MCVGVGDYTFIHADSTADWPQFLLVKIGHGSQSLIRSVLTLVKACSVRELLKKGGDQFDMIKPFLTGQWTPMTLLCYASSYDVVAW